MDHHHGSAAGGGSTPFGRGMDEAMNTMMADMNAARSGDPDMDFLVMMIPHHQGAVDMARLELVHGRDPATRKLAEDIIAGQQVEIEAMKRRLAILRDPAELEKERFPPLGGTRGNAGPGE